jgi:glycosyltransferase involved in cell wall biosynthesis
MSEPRQPLISVIIPTYNRPERLAACLQALAQLDYPRDRFEVIVVDDGSPQPLDGVAANFKKQCTLMLLRQEKTGPATARNTGARQAKGDFFVFIDDDCSPAPDYLRRLAAHIANTPDCVIGGRTINALPRNLYATASQMLIDYLYSYYNANPNHARFLTSNNMALPAPYFHAVDGFDTSFPLAAGEDRELCDRWLHHGYRLIYAPEAIVYHSHVLTLRKFWRQHFNYGRGAASFHRTRGRRNNGGIKLEPISFYLNLLRYPFSQSDGIRAIALAALLILSQAANAAGFFLGQTRN